MDKHETLEIENFEFFFTAHCYPDHTHDLNIMTGNIA